MNKPPSTRISTYLLLLVFALSIPLFMAVGYSIYQDIQQSVEHSKTSVKAMLGMLASNTSSTLNKARYTLEQLAVRPLVKNIDSSKCDPILENIKSTSEKYANAAYSNLDGTVVCSAVEQPDGKPVNIGKTQGFQKLLKAKQFTVGEPFLGPITGKWVSLLSVPIWNERHEMIGGVHLPLDLMASVFDIPDQYLPEQTRYGLINQDGILVWHSVTPEKLIGTRPIAATVQLMSALRSGELEGVLSDGVTRYFASAPIPGTAWIAFAVVPDASIYAEPKRRAVTALIVTLFVIGLLMTLAIFIARRINRPISELGRVAVDIHNGNLDIRVNEEGPTEIAMLACEFNSMVTTLQQQNAQLSAFLENSAVIAWLKDESGRHVFCSNNFLKRFALTRDAAYGKTNHELFPADVADVMSRNDQQGGCRS